MKDRSSPRRAAPDSSHFAKICKNPSFHVISLQNPARKRRTPRRKRNPYNPFVFNQVCALFHSSPVSP
ncbi:MAG: hypothetical protein ACLP1Y_15385, partial [Candidatus Acidiferrales bacterium]